MVEQAAYGLELAAGAGRRDPRHARAPGGQRQRARPEARLRRHRRHRVPRAAVPAQVRPRDWPALRTPNTWEALDALRDAGLVWTAEEHRTLRTGYDFLRLVESRLRIVHNRSLDELPERPEDLEKLARRLGFEAGRGPECRRTALPGGAGAAHGADARAVPAVGGAGAGVSGRNQCFEGAEQVAHSASIRLAYPGGDYGNDPQSTTKAEDRPPAITAVKMSLKGFEFAQVEEGYLCELARGYLVVSEVRQLFPTGCGLPSIRTSVGALSTSTNPGTLLAKSWDGLECKLVIPEWESERHPDIVVYLTAGGPVRSHHVVRMGFPIGRLKSSRKAGATATTRRSGTNTGRSASRNTGSWTRKLSCAPILRRGRSQWTQKTLGPDDVCETKLLPGFKLPCRGIFEAAKENDE